MTPHIKGCKLRDDHLGVCRNYQDRPLIVQTDGTVLSYQRVSNFAKTCEDQSGLMVWKCWNTVLGMLAEPALFKEAAWLSGEDLSINPVAKRQRNDLVERAMIAGGANVKADRGTLIHGFTELLDSGKPATVPLDVVPDLNAYALATEGLEHLLVETFTVNDTLRIGGTPDRVSYVPVPDPDGVVGNKIVDLKTGKIDYPHGMSVQLACYAGSVLYDPELAREGGGDPDGLRLSLPPVSQDWGVIIHAPAGTGTAQLYWIELAPLFDAADFLDPIDLSVLVKRWRSTKVRLVPFSLTDVTPQQKGTA